MKYTVSTIDPFSVGSKNYQKVTLITESDCSELTVGSEYSLAPLSLEEKPAREDPSPIISADDPFVISLREAIVAEVKLELQGEFKGLAENLIETIMNQVNEKLSSEAH